MRAATTFLIFCHKLYTLGWLMMLDFVIICSESEWCGLQGSQCCGSQWLLHEWVEYRRWHKQPCWLCSDSSQCCLNPRAQHTWHLYGSHWLCSLGNQRSPYPPSCHWNLNRPWRHALGGLHHLQPRKSSHFQDTKQGWRFRLSHWTSSLSTEHRL